MLKIVILLRAIYEELGKYGSVENQVLCRQRVDDELEPNIRYCLYKMGRSNMNEAELLSLTVQGTPGIDLLKEKLEVRDVLHQVDRNDVNSWKS